MVAYQHPSGLNPLQRYSQASSILKGTSRASNEGWYESPLALDFQLHIRVDGLKVTSRIRQQEADKWLPGPELDESLVIDPTKVTDFAAQVVKAARQAGARSVGVVLHIADEFATTEIKPELENPGALDDLRQKIVDTPDEVLDDSSLSRDEHSWRLVPYPAAGSDAIATAVTLSRRTGEFVGALRKFGEEKNFPIAAIAVSAPLVALLALPEVAPKAVGETFIAVLPYDRFTVLAFFNEHGDLRLLRTLQHRGTRGPSNLRHAVSTTAAALEMDAPDIHILPLADQPVDAMIADLKVVFENSEIHLADWDQAGFDAAQPVEMQAATRIAAETDAPLAASHTFTTLRDEGWAVQDFLPIAREEAEIYPNRREMKMLRGARYTRFGIIGLTVLAMGWVGVSIANMARNPEWTFDQQAAERESSRLAVLGNKRKKIEHWDNLLADRSKAWASMELLARLFPDKSGFLIKSFWHSVQPENVPGQAQVGFVKEWRITGMAREEALERLADLNTREGITLAFSEVAEVTGNEAFGTDLPSRSIVVNVRTLENAGFKPVPPDEAAASDESTYPFMFDLTITQRFEAADPMAINVAKAP